MAISMNMSMYCTISLICRLAVPCKLAAPCKLRTKRMQYMQTACGAYLNLLATVILKKRWRW